MNCIKCGQLLVEGAKFCSNCGTHIEYHDKRTCPVCGEVLDPSAKFCISCGVKVEQTTTPPQPKPQPEMLRPVIPPDPANEVIAELKFVCLFEGTPTVGISKFSGNLYVYYDRIEFKKQLGNALVSSLGVVGMIAGRKQAKESPVNIYPFSEILDVSVGKYAGVYNTIVVSLYDGSKISFCPSLPGSSSPQNIVNIIKQYL